MLKQKLYSIMTIKKKRRKYNLFNNTKCVFMGPTKLVGKIYQKNYKKNK